ncbi:hypothetical protein [Hathewaya proteolytica]|uniref:hypothetical protein n=1 Tax=Hathewaya proteolytica TaxID=29365 RepID=UPI001A9A632D|nr:hypothetical protein [Hathewaya proteolytica]
MLTNIVLPNADIRFIAINNGVDSVNGKENDMAPFINLFNEFYAKVNVRNPLGIETLDNRSTADDYKWGNITILHMLFKQKVH